MFDIGFIEVFALFIVALLVIGPKDLPVVAKQIFLYVRKIRAGFLSVKSEVEKELDLDSLKEEFSGDVIKNTIGYDEFQKSLDSLKEEGDDAAKFLNEEANKIKEESKKSLDTNIEMTPLKKSGDEESDTPVEPIRDIDEQKESSKSNDN